MQASFENAAKKSLQSRIATIALKGKKENKKEKKETNDILAKKLARALKVESS